MLITKTISNTQFDKVQGNVYVDIQGIKCQVKTKFSLNEVYMEMKRLKINLK